MKELILSFNQVTGTIPSEISNLAEIEVLNLSHNSFSGAAFDALHNFTTLKTVNLKSNLFMGKVGNLMTLKELGECFFLTRTLNLTMNSFSSVRFE